MQGIIGILLMFMGAASGSLFQDPVVCKFNESHQCYVALGQRLHLQIPLVDRFSLTFTDKPNNTRFIVQYKKSNLPLNITRWQFDDASFTLILSSTERSDAGTYTLETFDANGTSKDNYTLQLNTKDYTPHILGLVCVPLIAISVLAFYIYKKKQGRKNKEAQAQDDAVEHAIAVTPPSQKKKKKKKKEDEVQYGELVFNNPAEKERKMPLVQQESVYSQVQ